MAWNTPVDAIIYGARFAIADPGRRSDPSGASVTIAKPGTMAWSPTSASPFTVSQLLLHHRARYRRAGTLRRRMHEAHGAHGQPAIGCAGSQQVFNRRAFQTLSPIGRLGPPKRSTAHPAATEDDQTDSAAT